MLHLLSCLLKTASRASDICLHLCLSRRKGDVLLSVHGRPNDCALHGLRSKVATGHTRPLAHFQPTSVGLQSESEATQKQPVDICSALLPSISDGHDRPSRHEAVFTIPLPREGLETRSIIHAVTSRLQVCTCKQRCPPVPDACLPPYPSTSKGLPVRSNCLPVEQQVSTCKQNCTALMGQWNTSMKLPSASWHSYPSVLRNKRRITSLYRVIPCSAATSPCAC